MITILVNGAKHDVEAPSDKPLLYVLRSDLELTGPQFGCGLAQCGPCSVLLKGREAVVCSGCVMPSSTRGFTTACQQ